MVYDSIQGLLVVDPIPYCMRLRDSSVWSSAPNKRSFRLARGWHTMGNTIGEKIRLRLARDGVQLFTMSR